VSQREGERGERGDDVYGKKQGIGSRER